MNHMGFRAGVNPFVVHTADTKLSISLYFMRVNRLYLVGFEGILLNNPLDKKEEQHYNLVRAKNFLR